MKVECFSPPALVVISGKKYIVPLWQEVPMGTKLADLDWSRPGKKEPENPIIKEEFVTGSTGNEYFVRLFKDGTGECECWGYRRHKKDCRHIRLLKGKPRQGKILGFCPSAAEIHEFLDAWA